MVVVIVIVVKEVVLLIVVVVVIVPVIVYDISKMISAGTYETHICGHLQAV